jgi:hypothetical protein
MMILPDSADPPRRKTPANRIGREIRSSDRSSTSGGRIMGNRISGIIALAGLVALLTLVSPAPEAHAQAIGFQPNVQPFGDGVFLNATPVVTADRRYVRLGGINANFTALQGVQPFTFNAGAVSGGGVGGIGGFGGAGGLGGAGGFGGVGGVGGFNNIGPIGNVGGGAAIVPGLGAVGPVGGFYGGYGSPYGFPGGVYSGYPAGPLYTGPQLPPQQTINALGPLGGSI